MPSSDFGIRPRTIAYRKMPWIRRQRLGSGGPLAAFKGTAPTSWYDAHDLTSTSQQTLPNRVGAGVATLGSTGSGDSNDPVALPADILGPYFYTPSAATNQSISFVNPTSGATGDLTLTIRVNRTVVGGYVFGNQQGAATGAWGLYWDASNIGVFVKDNVGGTLVRVVALATFTNVTLGSTGDYWFKLQRVSGVWTMWAENGSGRTPPTFTTPITLTGGSDGVGPFNSTTIYRIMDGGSPAAGYAYYCSLVTGSGTVTVNPAIETVGQTSWTCSTGQTVTVNRSTTGYTAAVVDRPLLTLDGVDDYAAHPAGDTPTFTVGAGGYTVMQINRVHNLAGAATLSRVWSSESAANNGACIYLDAANAQYRAQVGGATTTAVTAAAVFTASTQLHAVAAVFSAGTAYAYSTTTGLTSGTSYAGVGTITHTTPRIGARADSVAQPADFLNYATVIWTRALTATELTAAATFLLGTYS